MVWLLVDDTALLYTLLSATQVGLVEARVRFLWYLYFDLLLRLSWRHNSHLPHTHGAFSLGVLWAALRLHYLLLLDALWRLVVYLDRNDLLLSRRH